MRKLIVSLLAAVVTSCVMRPAFAGLSATLTLEEGKAGRLYARVKLCGIADCPTTGSVTIVFTSPDEEAIPSFEYEAPWRACSQYAGEDCPDGGSARTWAYRTVRRGKRPVLGTWKVAVKAGQAVLATGEYEVK